VLGLCADAGLVEAGLLAVDGTRLAAAASNHEAVLAAFRDLPTR
jgi:hypothetical protein